MPLITNVSLPVPWDDSRSPDWGFGFILLACRRRNIVSVAVMLIFYLPLSYSLRSETLGAQGSSAADIQGQV